MAGETEERRQGLPFGANKLIRPNAGFASRRSRCSGGTLAATGETLKRMLAVVLILEPIMRWAETDPDTRTS